MAAALGEVGAGSSVGYCACLTRELSGEPDAGNLHLRFDEGRVGRAIVVALSPTLPSETFRAGTFSTGTMGSFQPELTAIAEVGGLHHRYERRAA